ncbi:5-formyltetrahydrofolate cyclo-ligase [Teredinibacter haidensis]|uniref:5-formyltetrahydrofolate cyclo-ligase n=1 Tax=Teredinibacter haidensis TaxID=2731755 RepID=UPI000948C9CF|nr:5-formyltetrahydrofolate cyclo-ligase [Teredinibacter haidensis]
MNKAALRSHIRSQRNALSSLQQRTAASNLCNQIVKLPEYKRARHIALYFANDGEISPHHLGQTARSQQKKTYYPVLTRQQMIFRPYKGRQKLMKNRFNIPEPLPRYRARQVRELDIVFLPLVAFDEEGNRLGMGGGFYDRTFAFKNQSPFVRPLLIGLAHQLQQQGQLITEAWDIPLDMIATDKEVITVRHRRW